MAGMDRHTGKLLDGFDHVVQSIEVILTTGIGERVMREWFGSPVTRLLGENLTDVTILRWWTIVWASIELFEPRYRLRQLQVNSLSRLGEASFTVLGEYRPYAHLQWQQMPLYISIGDNGVSIRSAR